MFHEKFVFQVKGRWSYCLNIVETIDFYMASY